MEIRRLRYFLAVAEEGHITRAAERLGLQQPPLSQQIKVLETELQTQLFRRTPKGVELTDAGRALRDDAAQIIADVERAAAKVVATARGEQGRIAFGFTHSTAFHEKMLSAVSAFHDAYPKVELELIEATTGELTDEVRQSELDVALVRSEVTKREGLIVHDLGDEAMRAAVPAGHPLAIQKSGITLEQLAREPLVLYRRATSPGLYDAIISAFRARQLSPWIAQEASHLVASINLVSAGFGLTLVPQSITAMQLRGVVYRRLAKASDLSAPIKLVHPNSGQSEISKNLVAVIRKKFR